MAEQAPNDREQAAGSLVVIGAGLMGSGIAQVAAAAGYQVTVRDVTDEALARGTAAIARSLDRFVGKGTTTREDADAALARITTTTDLDCVSRGRPRGRGGLREPGRSSASCSPSWTGWHPPGALLATNTSAIPITRIAAATERPESVVGTHFFSPVPMMALCELVRGYQDQRRNPVPGTGLSPSRSARPASSSTGTSPASSPRG